MARVPRDSGTSKSGAPMPADFSGLLNRAHCEEMFGIAQKAANALGVSDIEMILSASTDALTRFANNTIHQNVAERIHHISVRVLRDQRTARASTNRLDRTSIE